MSYGVAQALQAAIYQTLSNSADLTALVGTAIYDAIPPGSLPPLYVALGAETAKDRSDKTGAGAWHELTISVVTEAAGFSAAKQAAAAVSDALIDAPLALSRGALVSMQFLRAKAQRTGTSDMRQIDLIFRAAVSDD